MVQYTHNELDEIFAALGDPARRGILERVAKRRLTITELARAFPISLPAIPQHLRIPAPKAGLLQQSKEGGFRRSGRRNARLVDLGTPLRGTETRYFGECAQRWDVVGRRTLMPRRRC